MKGHDGDWRSEGKNAVVDEEKVSKATEGRKEVRRFKNRKKMAVYLSDCRFLESQSVEK